MKWLCLVLLFLAGCSTVPNRAPVVHRYPTAPRLSQVQAGKDWRPQVYIVKKGDTLFGIALEFGMDYREIANWNNINDLNKITVGRELRLTPPQNVAVTKPLAGMTIPLQSGAPVSAQDMAPAADQNMLKTQPVGVELPYSDKALQQLQPTAPQPVQRTEEPAVQPVATAGALDWGWPTNGKVVAGFSENANLKGVDIAGKMGQLILASAPGKVVYTGSGLRGYGKLIIIKHDKTYLSAYAHNSKILVKEGQMVKKGEQIGEMGDSDANQVMLHFEIRRFGKPVDPMNYLKSEPYDQGAHR